MRKVLVAALGALTLAGCVHHEGPYRGAGYGHGGFGHQRSHVAPPWFQAHPAHRRDWQDRGWQDRGWQDRGWQDRDRDRWRDRRYQRDGWWRGG